MLIHPHDRPRADDDWRRALHEIGFGHLVAAGHHRALPVVVPTQFLLDGDHVLAHVARVNPIIEALTENDQALLSVAGDWAFIPSDWKVVGDEDPRQGIPTTYYRAVQVSGPVELVRDPVPLAALLRRQLGAYQPDVDVADPAERDAQLRAIVGLRLTVAEVRAKFKYGGNVDDTHRDEVARRLRRRDEPGDRRAAEEVDRIRTTSP